MQATGVLADLSSMPPGYDWSYTSLLPLGGQTTITLSNITLDLGRVYELTAWINSEVQSGLSATNGAQTVLGVDFGHTMSFPTSGAVFNLPEGFSVNSADGAIVNNQWIDPRPAAVVPVPATVWLFGSGLLGLVGMARRKKTYMISKNNYKLLSRLICRVALFAPLAVPISIQAAPVLGTPSNNVSASASGGAVGIVWDSCGNPSLSGSNPVGYSCEAGNVSGAFNMIGSASAGMGAVHLGTSATAGTVGTDSYSGSTNASAYLADYFAISGPANSTGHLYGSFVVDGNLSVGVGGSALSSTAAMSSYSIQASLAGVNTERSGSWTLATNGYDQQSNISGSVLPIDASISFGSDGWAVIALSIYGQANSNGNAVAYQQCSTCVLVPGSFSTAATFGNTIYWGGISSVTVNGSPLTNFEFISASGADYRYATAPIPIPAAAWLFGSGLLGLIGVARRKRCR
ncbi:MAG: VPLPA-CTERM sorting domain-containing protein [Gammaproteobacteria bacterium]|nr:VPLPA-CTERM sorting domain-containing protein [Gammaproteobacteria bacterium]